MAGLVPAIHVFGAQMGRRKLGNSSMSGRDELRRELGGSLTSLINSISSAEIDQQNRELLAEFVENFEYGVALDGLHSLIRDRKIQLSPGQDQEMRRLAQRMKIDLR
jgi:hypothetical protein